MTLSPFVRGLLAAWLLSIGGQGIHWFIGSTASYDASAARVTAVALQALVGTIGGIWLILSHARHTRAAA